MRAALYFCLGFFLAVTCGLAYAEESIPATQTYDVAPSTSSYFGQKLLHCSNWPSGTYFLTADEAKSYIESLCTGVTPGNPRTWTGNTFQVLDFDGVTWRNVYNLVTSTSACPSGYTKNAQNYCQKATYSCPANQNWTLVGQSCFRDSCLPGETRDQYGVCQAPPPTCNSPVDTVMASGYYNVGTSPSGSPPVSACLDHCTTTFEGRGPFEVVINGVKNYFMQGAYYSDGEYCATNTPIVPGSSGLPSATCGANQQQGTINGKTVCVDKNTNQPVPTDAPKTTTEQKTTTNNPDGSTTETTTKTNPDGTKTTTTVVTGTNGTKTTTTTTNGGQSEQPADGSATEATQKDILNELKKKDCEKDSTRIECQGYDIPEPAEVDLPAIEKTVSITPVSIGPAGSCPSDHVVDFLGQPLTISWALPCQYATGIRPVVLTVAWLSAALILVGGFKQE